MIFPPVRHEVSFWNLDGSIPLQADLVLPPWPGPHPVAVLVAGAGGPRDRRRWTASLAGQGVATLSWDSPGWGATPGRRSWQAPDERTTEVLAAVEFLRNVGEVGPYGVAVVGADSGAWAAALAAGLSSRVTTLVLLAPPATGVQEQEMARFAQRLQGMGFISAEIGLALVVLRQRLRWLAEGYDPAAILAAEAPCRGTPWYGWLPGGTPEELVAFAALAGYQAATVLAPVRCPVLAVLGTDDPATPAWPSAALLRDALTSPLGSQHQIAVLPCTDEAFAPPGSPGWAGPRIPGDWHPDVVELVARWLLAQAAAQPAGPPPTPVTPVSPVPALTLRPRQGA